MSAFLGVLALLLVLAALLAGFMRLNAARLATTLRLAGPAMLGLAGLGLLAVGRAALGGMLLSAAAAWYGAGRARRSARKTPGKRSTVRTAALEMELDPLDVAVEGHRPLLTRHVGHGTTVPRRCHGGAFRCGSAPICH